MIAKQSRVVLGRDVWPAIDDLTAAPGAKAVAVAYVGSEGATFLSSLGRGDLLVCNASDASLAQGGTFPTSLATLVDRGVEVRSRRDLHAKVFVSGDRAFVGSANASQTSASRQEAGILVEDPAEVALLRAWVDDLATSSDADRVNDAFLRRASEKFRKPKGGGGGSPGSPSKGRPLWFVDYGEHDEPVSVQKAAKAQAKQYRPSRKDQAGEVDHSWGPKGEWRTGDRCVWVERDGGDNESTWWAYPPAECLGAEAVGGRSKQWLYWWRTPGLEGLEWDDLRRHVLVHAAAAIAFDTKVSRADVVQAVDDAFGVVATS